ncbi:CBO0543 family protein [Tuberibacillus sp. Marseille-P3662]|uniref:CBO0543 family protein n=1 Tax=Tuberibacillus sp. Marseille-P3662 TaxID=1965358 RepID=UPI000A1C7DA5|nr:CBO0543 family protein [Tuberibacillus sp. Marseille-P3662]
MLYIIITLFALMIAWKYGDWRHWGKYYPTILFMIVGNLIYGMKAPTHPFWLYHSHIFPNHISMILLITLIQYPCYMLVYLYQVDKSSHSKKISYMMIWIGCFSFIEWAAQKTGNIHYYNHWSLVKSLLFNSFMFPVLYLHYKRPLWAWTCAGIVIIFVSVKYHEVLF